jgi:spore coat protein U-like protein
MNRLTKTIWALALSLLVLATTATAAFAITCSAGSECVGNSKNNVFYGTNGTDKMYGKVALTR